ncbi:hypothetical protein CDL15_Pgr012328 [Punica granatum]|uniref:Uncharacterized protein n=1 Tax=Punica granatum TaxID=22663 RepID=A0A218Y417_PUNGR|nr:hypothetical protein CDL15_Pgr012328 [Punica granatum]PKI50083.1 hypothetical protein CRG98_029521 [Punica granatum]
MNVGSGSSDRGIKEAPFEGPPLLRCSSFLDPSKKKTTRKTKIVESCCVSEKGIFSPGSSYMLRYGCVFPALFDLLCGLSASDFLGVCQSLERRRMLVDEAFTRQLCCASG